MRVIDDSVDFACRRVILRAASLQRTYRARDSHAVVFADFEPRTVLLGGVCLGKRLASLCLGSERGRDGEELLFQRVQVKAQKFLCVFLVTALGEMSQGTRASVRQTYAHVIEAFLFLECIVDVGGDKRVHEVLVVAVATVDGFALAFWSWPCLGHELVEEPDCRSDEGRFGVGHVGIELGQVMEQAIKGGAVDEDLKDRVRKAHVSRVDEAAGTDFHDGLAGGTGREEGQQLGFFARGDGGDGGCRDGEADDGGGGEGVGFRGVFAEEGCPRGFRRGWFDCRGFLGGFLDGVGGGNAVLILSRVRDRGIRGDGGGGDGGIWCGGRWGGRFGVCRGRGGCRGAVGARGGRGRGQRECLLDDVVWGAGTWGDDDPGGGRGVGGTV
jgi:hypothetical protein